MDAKCSRAEELRLGKMKTPWRLEAEQVEYVCTDHGDWCNPWSCRSGQRLTYSLLIWIKCIAKP